MPPRSSRWSGGTQSELAAAIGITQPAIAQLETRQLDAVQLGTLDRVLRSLGYHAELVITDPADHMIIRFLKPHPDLEAGRRDDSLQRVDGQWPSLCRSVSLVGQQPA